MPILKCCVFGCNNKRKDAHLHSFPVRDERRFTKWIDCLNTQDQTYSKENLRNSFVCHIHFEKRFIKPNSRLRFGAYPSLFTREEISRGLPEVPFEDMLNDSDQGSLQMRYDHTYCKRDEPTTMSVELTGAISVGGDVAHRLPAESTAVIQPSTSFQLEVNDSDQGSLQLRYDHTYCKRDEPTSKSVKLTGTISVGDDVAPGLPAESTPAIQPSTSFQSEGLKTPTIKRPRMRLINKIKDLSPKCAKIYKEYNKVKNQANFLKRAKKALKKSKEISFEDIEGNLSPFGKKILDMQIRLSSRNKYARRFTDSDKLIALSIMKQSPKCYRFLRKILILPAKSTLNKMIADMNIEVGINSVLVEAMKKEVAVWSSNKKFCSIIFDEMHLTEALNYNEKKDEISGFVHLDNRAPEFADQAFVIMLRGAVCKWQQPFAFYYCKGTTSPVILKKILKEVVTVTKEIGLQPVATICDQGSGFRKALQDLQNETRREQILANLPTDETIQLAGITLNVIYDPSHLIKGLRNNFLTKNLVIDGRISNWQDIVDVYMADCDYSQSRLLPRLKDHHVIPDKIDNRKKMKVKVAAQVFSSTVCAALKYTTQFPYFGNGKPVSPTTTNTADTVDFFDKLFDSMNGASLHHKHTKGKLLRKAVTSSTTHHTFWREAIQKLEKIKFIDEKGNKITVPTIKNCITTLKSLMRLWQFFKDQGLKVMRPRYFNSDPIENFFGQVRAYNFRHNDPDCHSFLCTFRSLLITRLINFHSDSYNCEDDQADQLLNLEQVFKLTKRSELEEVEESELEIRQPDHPEDGGGSAETDILNQARRERLLTHSRSYTAGWVLHKLKTPCDECKKKLKSQVELPIHNWISHREYNKFKKSLDYPSEKAVRCFGHAVTETNSILDRKPHLKNISSVVISSLKQKYDIDLMCPKHQDDNRFIKIVIKFAINNWCNTINNILKGTDIVRLERRVDLPTMQRKALDKYKKKFRNRKK